MRSREAGKNIAIRKHELARKSERQNEFCKEVKIETKLTAVNEPCREGGEE